MSATVLTFSTTLCIGIHVTPQASSCRSVVGDVAQGMYIRMLCTCAACTWRAFPSGREGGADGAEVVFPRRTASFYPITYIRTRLCVRSDVSVSAHEIAGAQDVCVCVRPPLCGVVFFMWSTSRYAIHVCVYVFWLVCECLCVSLPRADISEYFLLAIEKERRKEREGARACLKGNLLG